MEKPDKTTMFKEYNFSVTLESEGEFKNARKIVTLYNIDDITLINIIEIERKNDPHAPYITSIRDKSVFEKYIKSLKDIVIVSDPESIPWVLQMTREYRLGSYRLISLRPEGGYQVLLMNKSLTEEINYYNELEIIDTKLLNQNYPSYIIKYIDKKTEKMIILCSNSTHSVDEIKEFIKLENSYLLVSSFSSFSTEKVWIDCNIVFSNAEKGILV